MEPNPSLARALVEPFDGPLRFLVHSLSRNGERHGVDLGAAGGNGTCECEHFKFTMAKAIRTGIPGPHRCKHIALAREYFMERAIDLLAPRHPHPDNRNEEPEPDPTPAPEEPFRWHPDQ